MRRVYLKHRPPEAPKLSRRERKQAKKQLVETRVDLRDTRQELADFQADKRPELSPEEFQAFLAARERAKMLEGREKDQVDFLEDHGVKDPKKARGATTVATVGAVIPMFGSVHVLMGVSSTVDEVGKRHTGVVLGAGMVSVAGEYDLYARDPHGNRGIAAMPAAGPVSVGTDTVTGGKSVQVVLPAGMAPLPGQLDVEVGESAVELGLEVPVVGPLAIGGFVAVQDPNIAKAMKPAFEKLTQGTDFAKEKGGKVVPGPLKRKVAQVAEKIQGKLAAAADRKAEKQRVKRVEARASGKLATAAEKTAAELKGKSGK